MTQSLSIRFQTPEQLTGPTKELFSLLTLPTGSAPSAAMSNDPVVAVLPPSHAQEEFDARGLRQRLRRLEKERSLNAVNGITTSILTNSVLVNPDLAERSGHDIVAEGLGKGHIFFGPPDYCLAAGRYEAVIELQVAAMLGSRRGRLTGEVILNNNAYLSQITKTVLQPGSHVFHLPFEVSESALVRSENPTIQVRLNMKSIVGIRVTQVAIIYRVRSLSGLLVHPWDRLRSAGNRLWRGLRRRVKARKKRNRRTVRLE